MKPNRNTTILLFILMTLGIGQVNAQGGKTLKPDINLTLIPPSPVTDKIVLDVRAGFRNNTEKEITLQTFFFLDDDENSVLHKGVITIPPLTSNSIKFPWSTKGQVGHHKISLTAKSGKSTFHTSKPIEVIASPSRSTQKIDGAFLGFYHWSEDEGKFWNEDIKKMSDSQWAELVEAQMGLDMNIIVIQESFRNEMYVNKHAIGKDGYQGLSYYPSQLFPGRMPISANDPIEAVLTKADQTGMHVFMAVGLYAWFDFSDGSLNWHKKVAKELWDRYGHHPSFYGWYISEEQLGSLGDEQAKEDIVTFFREFRKFVHDLSGEKPIMLATNTHGLRGAEENYRKLLPYLDILSPFGFHRMPPGDLTGEEVAVKLQKLCDEAGTHLWMDMEVFDFGKNNALVPRSIEGLLNDLHRFPNFEKIICYQFPGLLNSPQMSIKPGGERTVKLYQDYKKYLEKNNLKKDTEKIQIPK